MALYAVEENRSYGTKNGVCLESDADAEFSSAVPGVWDQRKDRIQMEGALFARRGGWEQEESRRPRSSPEQLPEEVVCEIVRLKLAHLSWGPRKIRELYLRGHGGGGQ